MDKANDIKALFIIVNAGFAQTAVEIAREHGAGGATIINARGAGSIHKSFMGITVDTEKEIVLSLVDKAKAERIVVAIKEKAGVSSPMNGICFIMPVDRMTGLNTIPSLPPHPPKP